MRPAGKKTCTSAWSVSVVALVMFSCACCCNAPQPVADVTPRIQLRVNSTRKPRGRRLLADCSSTPVCERLPFRWYKHLDEVSGCYYYWNSNTEVSTWDSPPCPPVRAWYSSADPSRASLSIDEYHYSIF